MIQNPLPTIITAGVLAALPAFAPAPAAADVLILQSSVPGLNRGDRLLDRDMLDVPAGKRVDILRPGGQTQGIVGPRRQNVGDLTRGEALNEPVWKRMLEDLKADTHTAPATGATRGVSR